MSRWGTVNGRPAASCRRNARERRSPTVEDAGCSHREIAQAGLGCSQGGEPLGRELRRSNHGCGVGSRRRGEVDERRDRTVHCGVEQVLGSDRVGLDRLDRIAGRIVAAVQRCGVEHHLGLVALEQLEDPLTVSHVAQRAVDASRLLAIDRLAQVLKSVLVVVDQHEASRLQADDPAGQRRPDGTGQRRRDITRRPVISAAAAAEVDCHRIASEQIFGCRRAEVADLERVVNLRRRWEHEKFQACRRRLGRERLDGDRVGRWSRQYHRCGPRASSGSHQIDGGARDREAADRATDAVGIVVEHAPRVRARRRRQPAWRRRDARLRAPPPPPPLGVRLAVGSRPGGPPRFSLARPAAATAPNPRRPQPTRATAADRFRQVRPTASRPASPATAPPANRAAPAHSRSLDTGRAHPTPPTIGRRVPIPAQISSSSRGQHRQSFPVGSGPSESPAPTQTLGRRATSCNHPYLIGRACLFTDDSCQLITFHIT